MTDSPYCPYVETFKKTKEFSYLADFFLKNNKSYTLLPQESKQYIEFWKDVRRKCLDGFTNSEGIYITGVHFFYLNFVQILGKDEKTGKKKKIFPRFLDIDYEYFHTVEYAKKNQKNLILVKPRRLGFSYKGAAIAAHEFNFFRDSRSMIASFFAKYCEQTMSFTLDNLNFLNNYTEFRKERNPDTPYFVKARYQANVGGLKTWKGYQSEITIATFKDNPFAAVGQGVNWLFFEEAGVFKNIIDSYNMSEPTIKDGADYTGCAIIYGSAGSMEEGSDKFYEMFIEPSKYNALEFPDPDDPNKKVGWFVSSLKGRLGNSKITGKPMVDEEGNSLQENALEDIKGNRELKTGFNVKTLHDFVTQFPLSYKEAFLRTSFSPFPIRELQEWLGEVETSSLKDSGKKVELYFDSSNKIKSRLNPDLNAILDYPLKPADPKEGCVVIYEDPQIDESGYIPHGLYVAGCDPIDQDKADYSSSLGSFIVYKRFWKADKSHDIIVAEYTGRPEFVDTFYENCRKLCLYYNAKCLYENNLKGFKVYFETKHSLHLLYEVPSILKDIVKDTKVNRGYGVHMIRGQNGNSGIKDQLELYLKQWLLEERKEENKTILNLQTIKSIPILKELIYYSKEGNYDRIIAFMLCILQTKEMHKIHVEENSPKTWVDTDSFFKKHFFVKRKQTY